MKRGPIVVLLALAGCAEVGARQEAVVYGTDDRLEVFEAPAGVHRDLAETAIAVQLDEGWLDRGDPADVWITYDQTLQEAHDLCPDVAFQDQIEPGTCSGTLIDSQHLLTAGHCVPEVSDCDGVSYPWVFGFSYTAPGVLRTLSADDVYGCVERVVFRNDDEGDFAIVRLDRPVVGHAPAPVRASSAPVGTALTMIGHPNGIPMKLAGDATVLDVAGIELHAEIDAFFGNSGSAVFDDGGAIVGILVAGSPDDYRVRPGSGGCSEPVVLGPGDDYEILNDVTVPLAAFCATVPTSTACAAPGADAGAPDDDAGAPNLDAGSVVATDGGAAADAGPPGDDGGCGCRASGARPGLGGLRLSDLWALGLGLWARGSRLRRARRARRGAS